MKLSSLMIPVIGMFLIMPAQAQGCFSNALTHKIASFPRKRESRVKQDELLLLVTLDPSVTRLRVTGGGDSEEMSRNRPERDSLFFTPQEMTRIEVALNEKGKAEPSTRIVKLESLLYFDPTRWVFWLEGKKWTPETEDPQIQVLEVGPQSVRFTFTPAPDADARTLTLSLGQSLDLMKDE